MRRGTNASTSSYPADQSPPFSYTAHQSSNFSYPADESSPLSDSAHGPHRRMLHHQPQDLSSRGRQLLPSHQGELRGALRQALAPRRTT